MIPAVANSEGTVSLGPGDSVLAFDVGGTDIKAALVDATGAVHEFERVATPPLGPDIADGIIASISQIAKGLIARYPGAVPLAAGVIVPGQVDTVKGIAVQAENIGWKNVPIRDRVAMELSLPVAFGHDVMGAGEAEKRLGAGSAFDNMVFVSIGTGLSCAIFIKGEPYVGTGMAGELGNVRVASEPLCSCGGYGCIEAISSAAAIVRRYNELSGAHVRGAKEVLELVEQGDVHAKSVWDSALDALASGLSTVESLFAPEAIILGGGLSSAGDTLVRPLSERLDSLRTFQARPQLMCATLGQSAGIVGAALLAREREPRPKASK